MNALRLRGLMLTGSFTCFSLLGWPNKRAGNMIGKDILYTMGCWVGYEKNWRD